MFCKAAVHLILHLVNYDNAVSRYPALDFQKEIFIKLIFGKTMEAFRLREKAFLR